MTDPADRADLATVFWHPDASPTVVILTTALEGQTGLPLMPDQWPGDVVRRDAADGAHILITEQGFRHQLQLLPATITGKSLAAIIPLDERATNRTAATLRFKKYLTTGRRQASRPRLQRLDRLIPTLRALDGRLAGANYRTIADGLFGPSDSISHTWKTSSTRDRVIRLVRSGVALMKGGYLKLLRSRLRD